MLLTLANVVYVLVALAMIILILLQRGAGATAGSGFGAGASATVFGARGSANFLSKSTAVLATLFFIISLSMAVYASRAMQAPAASSDDLGVMGSLQESEVPAAPVAPAAVTDGEVPAAPAETPAASTAVAPEAASPAGAPAASTTAVEQPAVEQEAAGDKQEQKGE